MENFEKKIVEGLEKTIKVPQKFEKTIKKTLYEEKTKNKNVIFNFTKIAVATCATLVISGGIVYASYAIYEKIWKEPERVTLTNEPINEETLSYKNITEEEAREKAKEKLINLGILDEIIGTDNYSDQITGEMSYRFLTKNWGITILGFSGEFSALSPNKKYDDSVEKVEILKEEAKQIANEYYKLFGYKDGEYELAQISCFNSNHSNSNEKGYEWQFSYYKKYGNLYNTNEGVRISFFAKNKELRGYWVSNLKCDNNPIEITKEQAIQIAKDEDRKIESSDIIEVLAELKIKKMNGNAYARLHNTEEYYKPMTTTDVPTEEIINYKTENRNRIVWVIVLKYGEGKVENFGENLTQEQETENLMNRYVKGQYSYYVDATTGEIIGGASGDDLTYDNYWNKYYAV